MKKFKEYLNEIKDPDDLLSNVEYRYFVVDKNKNIVSGWEYQDDAKEEVSDNAPDSGRPYKVYARRAISRNIENELEESETPLRDISVLYKKSEKTLRQLQSDFEKMASIFEKAKGMPGWDPSDSGLFKQGQEACEELAQETEELWMELQELDEVFDLG